MTRIELLPEILKLRARKQIMETRKCPKTAENTPQKCHSVATVYLRALSDWDQIVILQAIQENLAAHAEPVDEAAFNAELMRRVAEADLHPESLVPLDTAVAGTGARLQAE